MWYVDYLAPTGLTLTAGQTVTIAYTLTANVKTDDGFGNKFDPGDIISSGNTCTATGV